MVAMCVSGIAQATTPAGTVISNIAQIGYVHDGVAVGTRSNQVDIRVGEIIDLAVSLMVQAREGTYPTPPPEQAE